MQLAVQAATGGSREASLSALLTLQRQLSYESSALNARLSRVVTKLFTRVIKAEDADKAPWKSVDMTSLVRALDSHFVECIEKEAGTSGFESDSIQSCRKMAVSLVESICKAIGGVAIMEEMNRAGLDPLLSPLGDVIKDSFPAEDPPTAHIPAMRPQTPSRGVASLVSALGSVQSQSERDTALRALKTYTAEYGDEDLNLHLEQVSPAFRNFILEQLSLQGTAEDEGESIGNSSMAERLRNLRSRLNAKEGHAAVAVSSSTSRLVAPSPSRIVESTARSDSSADTGAVSLASANVPSRQSLRERLAAAQENRKNSLIAPETSSTSGSRAAALRARLQAVKQQAMQSSGE